MVGYKNNRERAKAYFKRKPWAKYINYIQSRCLDPERPYYKKGIKSFITVVDLETLWFRDKAYLLKRPSIDRLNPKKNYTFENCRFIELKENQREGGINRWKLKT